MNTGWDAKVDFVMEGSVGGTRQPTGNLYSPNGPLLTSEAFPGEVISLRQLRIDDFAVIVDPFELRFEQVFEREPTGVSQADFDELKTLVIDQLNAIFGALADLAAAIQAP